MRIIKLLATLSLFVFTAITATAQPAPAPDGSPSATIDFIRARRPLTVLALVSDEPGSSRAFARLGDPSFRWRLKEQLVGSVGKFNFDGLLINFEDVQTADEAGLRDLIGELRTRLAAHHKTIGVVLPADSFIDYKTLGSLAEKTENPASASLQASAGAAVVATDVPCTNRPVSQ